MVSIVLGDAAIKERGGVRRLNVLFARYLLINLLNNYDVQKVENIFAVNLVRLSGGIQLFSSAHDLLIGKTENIHIVVLCCEVELLKFAKGVV